MINDITKNQIKALYRKKLRPRLKRLESDRIILKNKLIFISVFFLLFSGLVYNQLPTQATFNDKTDYKFFFNIFLIIGALLITFYFRLIIKKYRSMFKQSIIREIFNLLIQDCNFAPEGKVASLDFDNSLLVDSYYNQFHGEDYVSGSIGNIALEFSELHVRNITGAGKNRTNQKVFRGLLFKASLRNDTQSTLLIHSNNPVHAFKKFMNTISEKKARPNFELVPLKNADFEKYFIVYAKEQAHAHQTMNLLKTDRLIRILKKYKEEIEISITGSHLYLMLHTNKNHFEPAIFSEPIKWKEVMQIYDILSSIVELSEQFNQNKE